MRVLNFNTRTHLNTYDSCLMFTISLLVHELILYFLSIMEDRRRKASNDGDHSGSQERAKVQRVEEGTHGEIIANHYNSIKEVGQRARVESNIYHMRNFNNWIKSQLIDKYMTMVKAKYNYGAPMCVLDMCCGKGGDLLKWREGE